MEEGGFELSKRGFLAVDQFGTPFNWRIHYNFTSYKTICGFILTLLMLIPIIPFAVYKYQVMRNYGETNIVISMQQDHFGEDNSITTEKNNFTVAFAFVAFDSPDLGDDISEYGEVKAFYKRWGEPNKPGTHYYEVASRPCTVEDLGLEGDNSKFWPLSDNAQKSVEAYKDKLQCIDDDIEVRGAYNSDVTQSLSIQFVACDRTIPGNEDKCRTHDEIRNFMKRKFIMTLENYSRFNLDEYNKNKITREAHIVWHPMNSILRQESVNIIKIGHVYM